MISGPRRRPVLVCGDTEAAVPKITGISPESSATIDCAPFERNVHGSYFSPARLLWIRYRDALCRARCVRPAACALCGGRNEKLRYTSDVRLNKSRPERPRRLCSGQRAAEARPHVGPKTHDPKSYTADRGRAVECWYTIGPCNCAAAHVIARVPGNPNPKQPIRHDDTALLTAHHPWPHPA